MTNSILLYYDQMSALNTTLNIALILYAKRCFTNT